MGTPTAELVLNPPQVEPDRISASATLTTPGFGQVTYGSKCPSTTGQA